MRPQALYSQQRVRREVAAAISWLEGLPRRKMRKQMRGFFVTRGPRGARQFFPWMHDASRVVFVETLRRHKPSFWQWIRGRVV